MLAPVPVDREHIARRLPSRLSYERADRDAAQEGVRLAYKIAGLPPPTRIIWCNGPMDLAKSLARAAHAPSIGVNVKAKIFDAVCVRIGVAAAASASPERIMAAVAATADVAATEALQRRAVRLRHALAWAPRILPRAGAGFKDISLGPLQLAAWSGLEYLDDTGASTGEAGLRRGLGLVVNNAGWIAPYELVCWIAERPGRLCSDAQGRLHSADGPALECRDGWAVWAWKGVQVPAWIIERPECITLSSIDSQLDRTIRRCMIEIMTPERYVRAGGAVRVAEDEAGTLWRANWAYRSVPFGTWSAVEVEDGSPDRHGRRKHYFLTVPSHVNSAREAVAWTYGMTPSQYAQLDLRT
jgi:hypothetical protein